MCIVLFLYLLLCICNIACVACVHALLMTKHILFVGVPFDDAQFHSAMDAVRGLIQLVRVFLSLSFVCLCLFLDCSWFLWFVL